ncbi:GGDEF domain-containing protein [Williamsia maris]
MSGSGFRSSLRQWIFGEHDYAWILYHHSMRPLHLPIRLVFAANTFLFGVCSALLLMSPYGPSGTVAVTWVLIVMVAQLAVIAFILRVRIPVGAHRARYYFVGFAIFGDVGLASVLVLYNPLAGAFGCALFVLNSALCTYFISSRWLLAHMGFAAVIIVYTVWRLQESRSLDTYATVAGGLVMIAAVCAVPIAAHVAWTLLSIDARQSLRDPLTGLHNRRGIDASLEPLWRAARAGGTAIGAVVIDVDKFKRINDTYGHDVGDLVLQQMSARMVGLAGPTAVVGRTGGEEFTIVLTGTVADVVDRVTSLPDRLRDAIDSAPVTVSVGAAVIESPRDHRVDIAIRHALRAADARMYDAKRSGGGRAFLSSI